MFLAIHSRSRLHFVSKWSWCSCNDVCVPITANDGTKAVEIGSKVVPQCDMQQALSPQPHMNQPIQVASHFETLNCADALFRLPEMEAVELHLYMVEIRVNFLVIDLDYKAVELVTTVYESNTIFFMILYLLAVITSPNSGH